MKRKYLIFVAIVALGLLLALYFLYYMNIYRINNKFATGIVKKINSEYWGIETEFPRFRISAKNLPKDLQRENAKVTCKISISDVIGTGGWDVYAEVSECINK